MDQIKDYIDFCSFVSKNVDGTVWLYWLSAAEDGLDYCTLYRIGQTALTASKLLESIKIFQDMHVEIFTDVGKVPDSAISWLLGDTSPYCLSLWSQVDDLLSHFGNGSGVDGRSNYEQFRMYVSADDNLQCDVSEEDDFSLLSSPNVKFLIDQLKLVAPSVKRKMESSNLSIEQVELIRRLRNSGASIQQISEAYQVFERLDREFGSFGLVKVTQSTQQVNSTKYSSSACPKSIHQNCQSAAILSDQNQERKKKTSPPQDNPQSLLQVNSLIHANSNSNTIHNYERPIYQTPSFSSILTEVASNAKSTLLEKEEAQSITSCDYNLQESKIKVSSPVSSDDSAPSSLQVKSLIQSHSKVMNNHNGTLYPSPSFSSVLTEVAANARSTLLGKEIRFEGITHGPQLINFNANAHRQSYPDQNLSSTFDNSVGNLNQNDNDSSSSLSSMCVFPEAKGFDNATGGMNDYHISMGLKPSESVVREAGRCMLLSASPDQVKMLLRKCYSSIPMFDPHELCSLFGLTDVGINKFLSGFIPHEGEYGLQIVDWFINVLSKTDWFISDVLKYSQQIMMRKQLDAPDAADFTPRKERFTFRDMHLEVLEAHFKKDRYPSLKEKEMIATECNIKMAIVANCELKEKERVTHINVDHWFRNKRKEIIRRARQENVDATKIILPSRVKSARLLMSEPSTSDSVEQQSFILPNAGTSPIHFFPSTQASDTVLGDSMNIGKTQKATSDTQPSDVNGSPRSISSANSESKERSLSSYHQDLTDIVKNQSTIGVQQFETLQAKCTNEIKIEPVSEEENND